MDYPTTVRLRTPQHDHNPHRRCPLSFCLLTGVKLDERANERRLPGASGAHDNHHHGRRNFLRAVDLSQQTKKNILSSHGGSAQNLTHSSRVDALKAPLPVIYLVVRRVHQHLLFSGLKLEACTCRTVVVRCSYVPSQDAPTATAKQTPTASSAHLRHDLLSLGAVEVPLLSLAGLAEL